MPRLPARPSVIARPIRQPYAGTAIAEITGIEEDDAGGIKCPLDRVDRTHSRVGGAAFDIFKGDFGHTARLGQVRLTPSEECARCAYLTRCNHPMTIRDRHQVRNPGDISAIDGQYPL